MGHKKHLFLTGLASSDTFQECDTFNSFKRGGGCLSISIHSGRADKLYFQNVLGDGTLSPNFLRIDYCDRRSFCGALFYI